MADDSFDDLEIPEAGLPLRLPLSRALAGDAAGTGSAAPGAHGDSHEHGQHAADAGVVGMSPAEGPEGRGEQKATEVQHPAEPPPAVPADGPGSDVGDLPSADTTHVSLIPSISMTLLPDDDTPRTDAPRKPAEAHHPQLSSEGSSADLLDSASARGNALRSVGSSTSNFGEDFDFSDSASHASRPLHVQRMPGRDASSASLDAFFDGAASDGSRPSGVPQALRRMLYSPAPSHGTAASNADFDAEDMLADLEFPESFGHEENGLQIRLQQASVAPSKQAAVVAPQMQDDTDMFDDLELSDDALAHAAQWHAGNRAAAPAPTLDAPLLAVAAVPVHEVPTIAVSLPALGRMEPTELDDIDDLVVSDDQEVRFKTAPRLPTLGKRDREDGKRSDGRPGTAGPIGTRRMDNRSSLTAPTASFLAKMKEPVKTSSKQPNKKAKKPELIQNLGSANTVKVIGEMRWNPDLQKWEGNEDVLRDFDPVPPPLRPALITNFGASAKTPQTVGNMVWDPVSMSWRGNEDDCRLFDGFDDEDAQSMISVATGVTGMTNSNTRTFDVSYSTRQSFMAAERDHMISTSRWYPQRQGHVPSMAFQRLATRMHLAEIRNLVPND